MRVRVCVRKRPPLRSGDVFSFSKICFHSQKVSASSSIVCPGMSLTFKTLAVPLRVVPRDPSRGEESNGSGGGGGSG